MTRLDVALDLAGRGFHVFPLLPGSKLPAIKYYPRLASRDPDQLREWFGKPWSGYFGYANIGISTTRFGDDKALIALDVDEKGKGGGKSLMDLEMQGNDIPASYEQNTPTGGRHLVYVVDGARKQGVDMLGRGLDTRGRGGYIVAAGSTVEAGEYTGNDVVPIPAPAWLDAACPVVPEREAMPVTGGATEGRPVDRAIHYLENEAPLAVKGAGGDQCTYKVACRLRDLGVAALKAHELMMDHWNDRTTPGWSADRLMEKVEHAYTYGQNELGASDPAHDFDVVEVPDCDDIPLPDEFPAETFGRLHYKMFADVVPDLSRLPLVDRLLDPGCMSVIYGDSNSGKTFVGLDISFHVATGREWHGRRVNQGAVVYVAAEGGKNIEKRIEALRIHHNLGGARVPLAVVPCLVDLSVDGADVEELIRLIKAVECETFTAPVMVVLDTLSRTMGGGEENASADMTGYIANVDRIRAAVQAHCMIIHHTGKDRAKGGRGHSSLRAATDTEIEVVERTLEVKKQRDMEPCPPIGFGLQQVVVGNDALGRGVTSCVVFPRSISAAEDFRIKPLRGGSVSSKAFDVLIPVLRTLPADSLINREKWREDFLAAHYPKKRKSGLNSFDRAIKELLAKQYIVGRNGGFIAGLSSNVLKTSS